MDMAHAKPGFLNPYHVVRMDTWLEDYLGELLRHLDARVTDSEAITDTVITHPTTHKKIHVGHLWVGVNFRALPKRLNRTKLMRRVSL